MKLFVDTWAWLTLHDKREARHAEVVAFYRELRRDRGMLITTDYVLDETLTLLFRRLPFSLANTSLMQLQQAVTAGYLQLEWITPERFAQTLELRRKFDDKPRISFTDLTSMVVMRDCQVTAVLTEDEHFHQVGMGFQKVPS